MAMMVLYGFVLRCLSLATQTAYQTARAPFLAFVDIAVAAAAAAVVVLILLLFLLFLLFLPQPFARAIWGRQKRRRRRHSHPLHVAAHTLRHVSYPPECAYVEACPVHVTLPRPPLSRMAGQRGVVALQAWNDGACDHLCLPWWWYYWESCSRHHGRRRRHWKMMMLTIYWHVLRA